MYCLAYSNIQHYESKEVGKFNFLRSKWGSSRQWLGAIALKVCETCTLTIWIGNTWIPDSMGVPYSNGKVTWLGQPFKYRTFWNIKRLFLSNFHPPFKCRTIWQPDTNLPFENQTSAVFGWMDSNFSANAFNLLLTLSRVFDFLTFFAMIPPDQSPRSNVVTSGCSGVSSAISFARKMELRAIFVLTTERSQTK